MPDQHPASTSDARKRLRCGLCGDPARGYATIGDTRYCHEGDDPTCYQKAQKAPETHTGGARGSECSQCDVLEAEVVEYGMRESACVIHPPEPGKPAAMWLTIEGVGQ